MANILNIDDIRYEPHVIVLDGETYQAPILQGEFREKVRVWESEHETWETRPTFDEYIALLTGIPIEKLESHPSQTLRMIFKHVTDDLEIKKKGDSNNPYSSANGSQVRLPSMKLPTSKKKN